MEPSLLVYWDKTWQGSPDSPAPRGRRSDTTVVELLFTVCAKAEAIQPQLHCAQHGVISIKGESIWTA